MHVSHVGRTGSRLSVLLSPPSVRLVNRGVLGAASLVAAGAYALAYARHPRRPDAPAPDQGWWAAYDQIRYLKAAAAWASGDLDPAWHWYLPGYPLLGAPFVGLTPANPFLLPDLACLLASLWLTAALAARLAPGWPHAPALGAAAFLGVILLSPAALDAWVVPWTSSLAAPLTLACLAAAATLSRRLDGARATQPGPFRLAAPAFAAGLSGAAVALARPTDAALLLAAVGLALLAQASLTRPGLRPAAAAALAGSAGVTCGALLALVPYLAVHGPAPSDYLVGAARYGFEWRLIPLRWVTLVLSPRPLFPDGLGMAEAFPWFLPGVAGMAACLAAPPGGGARWTHAPVVAAAVAQATLYLAYRDLHPQGMWRYGNHHYFKWLLILLALYAPLLVALAVRRRWPGLAAGTAALLVLVPWRAELVRTGPAGDGRVEGDGSLVLPPMRLGVHDAVLAGATGTFPAIFHGPHTLRVGEQAYESIADFALFSRPGGLMLMPLRPLGAGPVRLSPAPGVTLLPGTAPILARARVTLGPPCWSGSSAPGCRPAEPIPPPPLPADGVLRFDGAEAAFLGDGWSGSEPGGRWTEGGRAVLLLPVPGPARVAIRGHALVPPGTAPLGLRLLADGREIGAWRVGAEDQPAIEAPLPRDGAGVAMLSLEIDAPRRPYDVMPGSGDKRWLGLFVRSVAVEPRP